MGLERHVHEANGTAAMQCGTVSRRFGLKHGIILAINQLARKFRSN
jgi:hypothetical protein